MRSEMDNLQFQPAPPTRRDILRRMAGGFGAVGLAGLLGRGALASASASPITASVRHLAPRAKRVIFLFMNGGPSHVDTFDPKPALEKYSGQKPTGNLFRAAQAGFAPSPFHFQQHGQSGVVLSELFPRLSQCADDLCVVRSMHTDVPNHEPGLLVMHSGVQQPVRPSLGSWISYGLGNENENLPSFVVLAPRRPVVGPQLWSSSFLPGSYQGMAVNTSDLRPERLVANLQHPSLDRTQQRQQLDLLEALNRLHLEQRPEDAALEAHIQA